MSYTVFPRREWTAVLPGGAGVDILDEIDGLPNFQADELKGISVHYTGAPKLYNGNDPRPEFEAIRYQDMKVKHWSDIMYNLGVAQNMEGVWELRGLVNKGAANGGGNKGYESTAVNNAGWLSVLCLVGKGEKPTDQLFENLLSARAFVLAKYPEATDIKPHKIFRPTECPGDDIMSVCFTKTGLPKKAFWDQTVTPPPPPAFTCPCPPPLQYGTRHMDVYDLQNLLAFFNYYLADIDGYYGDVTKWGVGLLQNDLKKAGFYPYNVDGNYGPKTVEGWCQLLEVLWNLNHSSV